MPANLEICFHDFMSSCSVLRTLHACFDRALELSRVIWRLFQWGVHVLHISCHFYQYILSLSRCRLCDAIEFRVELWSHFICGTLHGSGDNIYIYLRRHALCMGR